MLLLYALVNHIKVSPTKAMADYGSKFNQRTGNIEMTSWITRLAFNMGLLNTAVYSYIPSDRDLLTVEHFSQGHLLRENQETGEIHMIYQDYVNKIALPDMSLWLVNEPTLLLALETEAERNRRLARENTMQVPRRRT